MNLKVSPVLIFLVPVSLVQAQPAPPNLTDSQRSCLEGKLGAPESGKRPDRDQMRAAFQECGVEMPARPSGGRHGGPPLTEEQRVCMVSQLGEPNSGGRPTREQMEAALTACGVPKPQARTPSSASSFQGQDRGWSNQSIGRRGYGGTAGAAR